VNAVAPLQAKDRMRMHLRHSVGTVIRPGVAAAFLLATGAPALAASQCFGTVSRGRIERSVKLPVAGPNFTAYSTTAAAAGRTYVHSTVSDVVVAAYAALASTSPSTAFVYGETGWSAGGRFRPHRTHQNGLSVDFFVPVRDRSGRSVELPTSVANRFGYDIEFDESGSFKEFTIDFAAMAEHLYQLSVAAKNRGIGIALVIVDPPLLPKLFDTPRGSYLRQHVPFMKGRAWVRHDEHYHVDFAVPCKP
jgi:penicillin-insensitive murein endopeptidase